MITPSAGSYWRTTKTTWGNNVFAHENWEGRNEWMYNGRPLGICLSHHKPRQLTLALSRRRFVILIPISPRTIGQHARLNGPGQRTYQCIRHAVVLH